MDDLREEMEGLRAEMELDSAAAGPKGVAGSLYARGRPLAPPAEQLALLARQEIAEGEFEARVAAAGWSALRPGALEIFQINVGRLCNMTCRHCHVDAGPDRVAENMDRETVELCLSVLDRLPGVHTVDITGGAPELNPHFRALVDACAQRGKHVIDRCNLTVLLLPRFADLPEWLGERGVELVCSLPHHRARNTDAQRGEGTFERSLQALKRLNAAGYGLGEPGRRLTLMMNPAGAFLPSAQHGLEREFKDSLARQGVSFDRLIILNNMPTGRFLDWLSETGGLATYLDRLSAAFNPAAVPGLMCRNTLSVGWDGALYDCDFNQMLDLPLNAPPGARPHLRDFDPERFAEREIVTRRHCFGCTAGAGSSCGGGIT